MLATVMQITTTTLVTMVVRVVYLMRRALVMKARPLLVLVLVVMRVLLVLVLVLLLLLLLRVLVAAVAVSLHVVQVQLRRDRAQVRTVAGAVARAVVWRWMRVVHGRLQALPVWRSGLGLH